MLNCLDLSKVCWSRDIIYKLFYKISVRHEKTEVFLLPCFNFIQKNVSKSESLFCSLCHLNSISLWVCILINNIIAYPSLHGIHALWALVQSSQYHILPHSLSQHFLIKILRNRFLGSGWSALADVFSTKSLWGIHSRECFKCTNG